ncbi:MAG: glycosyltransferase family 39 protein, partial [Verrucomicrobia bacterium]|nr:glycosyltransferase family 39 protein [Verrucomicrobiota bacterium]
MEKHDSPVSRRWICAVLAALTLLVFGQVRHFDFINFDDPFIVSANPHIQDGLTLQGIRWAFSADFFSDSLHADYWQPVTFLSRMLDIGIFGMNAGMFHLVNLCFHLLNTLLLFHLLQRMTTLGGWPPPRGGEQATLGGWRAGAVERSAWVAALFAVHPLRVEAVAWVVERKELLCGFFWILTMLAYLRYVERPQWRRYVPVILLFAAALMSKPMAVTLPCVLLLMDWWPLGRGRGEGGWWMVDGGQRTMDPGPWT